jgi:hypothetical protein
MRHKPKQVVHSARCCCPILTKTGIYRQIVVKLPNIKFHENPHSANECGQTGMAKLISSFLQLFIAEVSKTLSKPVKIKNTQSKNVKENRSNYYIFPNTVPLLSYGDTLHNNYIIHMIREYEYTKILNLWDI